MQANAMKHSGFVWDKLTAACYFLLAATLKKNKLKKKKLKKNIEPGKEYEEYLGKIVSYNPCTQITYCLHIEDLSVV